LHRIIRGSDT